MKWLPLCYSLQQLGLNYEKEMILEDKHMYHIEEHSSPNLKLPIALGHHNIYGGVIK